MKEYTKKVAVTLTEEDYKKLEKSVENSRLTIGQMASTYVEAGIENHNKQMSSANQR